MNESSTWNKLKNVSAEIKMLTIEMSVQKTDRTMTSIHLYVSVMVPFKKIKENGLSKGLFYSIVTTSM